MFKIIKLFKWLTLLLIGLTIGFVITAIFLFPSNEKFILLSVIPVILLFAYILVFTLLVAIKAKQNLLSTNQILSINASEAFNYGEIGIVIVDENQDIIWMNNLLQNRGYVQFMGRKIGDISFELETLSDTKHELKTSIFERNYKVKYSPSTRTYIFKDVSDYTLANSVYKDETKVFMFINIDNYDSIIKSREESFVVRISMVVKLEITNWATKYNAFIKSYASDQYLVIVDQKDFEKIKDKQFQLLSDIKDKCAELNADVSLSIGASYGRTRTEEISELAMEAMELAISRGGNQVVIKAFGSETEFIGGTTESKVEKTKVAVRVLARTLRDSIDDYAKVFVVGHQGADFDSISSGMAVCHLASNLGKPAYHITDIDAMTGKLRAHVNTNISDEYKKKYIVSPQDASDMIDKDSLLIVVDTNIKSRTESPIAIDLAGNVIVIDHHRAGEDSIQADDKYISTSASSVAEIMVETLFYSNIVFKEIPVEISNMLLAGIMVDTNSYKVRTSTRTFEASSSLKQWGAEPRTVQEMLQDTPQEFKIKSDIFSSMREVVPGVVILHANNNENVEQSILAQVAESAINIKNVHISFAVGQTSDNQISISARSDGNGNVQKICEHFGGGGHFSAAGAKLENKSLGDVLVILEDEIKREDWNKYFSQKDEDEIK